MDRLRTLLVGIHKQLGLLTVTQKLLIASLCVLALMTFFLISQYAGAPATVALLPGGTAEDQQKAAAFLKQRGFDIKIASDGKVMMLPDQRYIALAAMTKEQQLPSDKKLMFESLVTQTSWIEDLQTKKTKRNYALQNELNKIIRAMGFDDAAVIIDVPIDSGGIGAAARKPVAQVTVFPPSGQGLEQGSVNALADIVGGSVAGLSPREIAVIDGRSRRSYKAVSADDLAFGGGAYIEQAAKVEKRLHEKIVEHLRFIPEVSVGVNAIVDAVKRERERSHVLPKGQGSLSMPTEETSATTTSSNNAKGGIEPGVQANTGADLNRGGGGGGGDSSNNETSTVKSSVMFGNEITKEREAMGRPTKINVTVNVPREYVAAIWKQNVAPAAPAAGATGGAAASAEPSEKDIADTFDKSVRAQIEGMILPLVETEGSMASAAISGAAQLVSGTVKVSLIPISMANMGGGMGGAGGSTKTGLMGGGGTFMSLLDGGIIKTLALGVLAVVALGMMFTMVRKAGKAPTLPTAEELVGIPPALEPGTEVVGEAVEGDTAMIGIEIDDQSLKTGKMLEEIGTLVKNNPQTAASVFNRWLTEGE